MAQGSGDLKKKRGEKKPINRIVVLVIVAICVLLAVAGYYAANYVIEPPATPTPVPTETFVLSQKAKTDVDFVEINMQGETLTIMMRDDLYYAKEYPQDTINQSSCSSLFYNAASLTSDVLVEENAPDLSIYGLDNPLSRVVAHYKDGSTMEFYVGASLPDNSKSYMMVQGDPNVYLAWSNIRISFTSTIQSLKDISIPDIAQDAIRRIVLERADQENIEVFYRQSSGFSINTWHFAQPFDDVYVNVETLQTLVEGIEAISFTGFEGRFDDLSPYGLDEPRARVFIEDEYGASKDFIIGNPKQDTTYTYVGYAGKNEVYIVSTSKLAFIDEQKVVPLADAFVSLINIASIERLQLTGFGEDITIDISHEFMTDNDGSIRKDSSGNNVTTELFSIGGTQVNTAATRTFYQSVIGVTINGRLDESAYVPGDPLLTVAFTLKDGSGDIVVEYLPFDKDHYAARVNGGNPHFYVRREKVDEIMTTLDSYLAGDLDADK